jgi:hypothetical protein
LANVQPAIAATSSAHGDASPSGPQWVAEARVLDDIEGQHMATVARSTEGNVQDDPQMAKLRLEVEYLKRQNEKLSFEINELGTEGAWAKRIRNLLPVITGLIAVAGFWFGIIQYIRAEAASRDQRKEAEQARLDQQKAADEVFRRDLKRETAKPLWDKQLALYVEATEKAAVIATVKDEKTCAEAEGRFWVLYWGPLAAVEDVGLTKRANAEIERQMVRYGSLLNTKFADRNRDELKQASLDLAHAVRNAIAPAFDVQATELAGLRKPTK